MLFWKLLIHLCKCVELRFYVDHAQGIIARHYGATAPRKQVTKNMARKMMKRMNLLKYNKTRNTYTSAYGI